MAMKHVLENVNVVSAARVTGYVSAIAGLLVGGFLFLSTIFGMTLGEVRSGFAAFIAGAGAVVMLPIGFGVAGLIVGFLIAMLYNITAEKFGGLTVTLAAIEENDSEDTAEENDSEDSAAEYAV